MSYRCWYNPISREFINQYSERTLRWMAAVACRSRPPPHPAGQALTTSRCAMRSSIAVCRSPRPTEILRGFAFSATGVSTATFKWDPAPDGFSGATSLILMNHDIQVSTSASFSTPFVIPGLATGTAMFSNYLRIPRVFDANTRYGVMLKSTEPWTAPAGAAR